MGASGERCAMNAEGGQDKRRRRFGRSDFVPRHYMKEATKPAGERRRRGKKRQPQSHLSLET
jgi:hypothetical protein